jgi:hypothetical protein
MDKTLLLLQNLNSFEKMSNCLQLNDKPNSQLSTASSRVTPEIMLHLTLISPTIDQTWNLGNLDTQATVNFPYPAEFVYSPSSIDYKNIYQPIGNIGDVNPQILSITVKESMYYNETTYLFKIPTILWDLSYGYYNKLSKGYVFDSKNTIAQASRVETVTVKNNITDIDKFTYSIPDGYSFPDAGSYQITTTFKKSGYISLTTSATLNIQATTTGPQAPVMQFPIYRGKQIL